MFFFGLILLLIPSCQEESMDNCYGEAISFFISVSNDIHTRTAFSGEIYDGVERIDWLENDQVDLFQYNWDSQSLNNKTVYTVVGIKEDGEKSVGGLQGDTPFVWGNGSYEFYSVYPVNGGTLSIKENKPTFEFNIPDKQYWDLSENMEHYAYLAAVSTKKINTSSDTEKVMLDYYPMVTTLYVTVTNNTQSNVNLQEIKLSSENGITLTGDYTATLDESSRRFITQDIGATVWWPLPTVVLQPTNAVTLKPDDSQSVALFIRPIRYQAGSLKLSVNTSKSLIERSLSANMDNISFIEPCKKYNIRINLREGGGSPFDVGDGGAQMIFQYLSYLYENQQQVLRAYFPNLDDFINNRFNSIKNKSPFLSVSDLNNTFTEEDFKIIRDIFESVTDLRVISQVGAGIVSNIEEKDFKIFPKLRTVELFFPGTDMNTDGIYETITVSIGGIETLEEFAIYPGSHGTIDLHITNCENFTTLNLSTENIDAIDVTIDGCKNLTTFHRGPKVRNVTIKNCNDTFDTE